MDRARAAGYIDNNFVQNQQRIRKRKDHLARLKKIMNRKPGSSVTLDNNPPVVQQATADDPRKKAKRGLFSVIIERENKVLLQRISAILLEPARNTVKEYNAMKKLIVPKNQGKARAYEQHMQKVRNDKFFANLRNQKPVYNVKAWEEDYKHQKYNQRFMREVKYQRPPGFVDPFAPPPKEEKGTGRRPNKEGEDEDAEKSPGRDSNSSAHVHRIRHMRQERSASGLSRDNSNISQGQRSKAGRSPQDGRGAQAGGHSQERQHHRGHRGEEVGGGGLYEGEDFEDDEDLEGVDGDEFKELLAETRRDVRVSEEVQVHHHHRHNQHQHHHHRGGVQPGAAPPGELKLHVYLAAADVRCWLVNGEVIVLSAVVAEEGRNLEAEAEISLEDLAVLRGEDPSLLAGASTTNSVQAKEDGEVLHGHGHPHHDGGSSVISMGFDLHTLQQVAQEMVAHVELRLDAESGPRLILNLVSEEDPLLGDGLAELSIGSAGPQKGQGAAGSHAFPHSHGMQRAEPASESLVSEDELGDMLIDDNRQCLFSCGTRIPVHFENQVITASVANLGTLIDAAKIKNRNEAVYALVKVVSTEEDQLAVTVHVMTNTVTQFKRFARPAVVKGTVLKIGTALPSVIHADPELVHVFARNMVSSIKIVHSNRTGKNSLTIENVGY